MLVTTLITVAGLILLAAIAVGCTPSTLQPEPVTSLPNTRVSADKVQDPQYLDQAVLANDQVGDSAAEIVDWYNALLGKSYRGRIIYQIDSISIVKGDKTNTITFAVVRLKAP